MAKKGDTVNIKDSDGGTTRAKVLRVSPDGTTLEIKWLEPRWNLNANVLIARKGTKQLMSSCQVAS